MLTTASAQTATQTYQGHDAVANEVLIKFEPAAASDAAGQAKVAADMQQAQVSANIDVAQDVGSAGWKRFHSASYDVTTLMSMLTGASSVAYVEPNWIYRIAKIPNDPDFIDEWGMYNTGQSINGVNGTPGADIGATSAWSITTGTRSVLIGLVDTGIEYTHADLQGNVWSAPAQYSFMQGSTQHTCATGTHGWNTLTNACDPNDDNGHGTGIAGILGAVGNNAIGVAGVNWTTTIITAKDCDATGSCTTSNIINAYQYMEGVKWYFGGRSGSANIRVLNNSYGGGAYSQAWYDEIENVYSADMLFAAGAGNSGTDNDTTPFYPASFAVGNIISTAATDNEDRLACNSCNPTDGFNSNYGPKSVHLGAPGVYEDTTWTGAFGYNWFSGTSAATPFVAGTGALTLSECLGGTDWLVSNIKNGVVSTTALTGTTIWGGRVNAYNSVLAASQHCPGTGDGLMAGNEQSRLWDGQEISDTGTVSITINGDTKTYNYGEWDNAYSIANMLKEAINTDSNYPVTAYLSYSNLSYSYDYLMFSAKTTGSGTCYTVSSSYTYNTTYFTQPSFKFSPNQGSLSGCK